VTQRLLRLATRNAQVSPERVPRCVVRSVSAVAGHAEDNFRRVCLETLRELAVACPRAVAAVGGLRCLFAAVLDPTTQVSTRLHTNNMSHNDTKEILIHVLK
jgi:Rapamycin-insensitive companion of mTOR, N-term